MSDSTVDSTSPSQLDPQQIRLLRGLRNGALLPQLLCTYRDQAAKQIEGIQAAVRVCDHDAVRLAAHALKSASFSIGAARMGELCAQLEANARTQTSGNTQALCHELNECYVALLPELDKHLTS